MSREPNHESQPNQDNQTAPRGLLKRLFLPLIGTMNVPPYAMFFFSSLYLFLVFTTNHARFRTALLAYLGYCFLDQRSPQAFRTSAAIRFLQYYCRKAWWVNWAGDYLRVSLVKTVDLPPPHKKIQESKEEASPKQTTTSGSPYIFSYHPHGLIGMGASIALLSDYCKFEQEYPGVRSTCVALEFVLENCQFLVL